MATDLRKLILEWRNRCTGPHTYSDILLAMVVKIEANSDDIKQLYDVSTNIVSQQTPPPTTEKLTDQQKSIYSDVLLKRFRACGDCKHGWIDHYTLTGVEGED